MSNPRPRPEIVPRRISVFGATGSVGMNTLDLVSRQPEAFVVDVLTAQNNVAGLARLARQFGARVAVIGDAARYAKLKNALAGTGTEIMAGAGALVEAAQRPVDWVMAAIVGTAGLAPTFAALRSSKVVAVANKECLVSAGDLVMAEVRRTGVQLLPVDSEHNAIFQVFEESAAEAVDHIVLTASGGPFHGQRTIDLSTVTPEMALKHPNWSMGAKISVDSATLMNKGLEMIEAYHLFPLREDQIRVVVHPQSVVHSMVCYVDGSVLAQMGTPDMRTPIAHTLAWPKRMAAPVSSLDLVAIGQLTFESPDFQRFPALSLARQVLQTGGVAPTILNAANEVAVAGFLAGRLGFTDIPAVVAETLARSNENAAMISLEDVLGMDNRARLLAKDITAQREGRR